MFAIADAEICLAFSFVVAVEDDFLVAALARRTKDPRLFAAELERRAIGIGAILRRDGRIVFLDASLHLREEFFPEFGRVLHKRRLVGVLGLEMRADRRIKGGGI